MAKNAPASSIRGMRLGTLIVNVGLGKGRVGCDIQWFRAPGPTGAQDEVFTQLLTTFALS